MALVDQKLNWTVASKKERLDGKAVVNLTPTTPEGIEFASPSEGIFLIIPKDICTLEVGQVIEGIVVARVDDGQTP